MKILSIVFLSAGMAFAVERVETTNDVNVAQAVKEMAGEADEVSEAAEVAAHLGRMAEGRLQGAL